MRQSSKPFAFCSFELSLSGMPRENRRSDDPCAVRKCKP